MSETSERATKIIAEALDDRMLGPSSRGSRFAARQLAEAIVRDLALANLHIMKITRKERQPLVIEEDA